MAGPTLRAKQSERNKKVTCPTKCTPAMIEKVRSVVENVMGQGGSVVECSVELDLDRGTLPAWEKKFDEINRIMHRGRNLHQIWWEKKGRLNMENEKFSYQGYKWMTMNSIGWSNNQNVETNVTVSSTVQDASNKRVSKIKDE